MFFLEAQYVLETRKKELFLVLFCEFLYGCYDCSAALDGILVSLYCLERLILTLFKVGFFFSVYHHGGALNHTCSGLCALFLWNEMHSLT